MVNTESFVILEVCLSAWLSVSSFSCVTFNDVASHILLLGIFQFVQSLVSFPQSKENNWLAVFLGCPFSFSLSFIFLFLSSFLSFSAHILNLQNLETLTKLCTLLRADYSPLRISKQRLTAGLQKPPSLKESEKKENDNRNNFRVNPARVINWLGAWEVERVLRRRKKLKSPDSSFFFKPISPDDVKQEIISLPNNKSYGLYSCPTQFLERS